MNNPIIFIDPSGHLSDEYLFRLAGDSPVNSGDYSQIKNPVARVYCAWGNTIPSKRISVLSNSSATFWGTEFYLRLLYLYEYKGIDVTQLSRNQLDAIYEEVHMNKVGELMAGLDASAMIEGNIGKYIVKGTGKAAVEGTGNKLTTNEAQLKHMFRDAEGHFLQDNPANRAVIEKAAGSNKNLLGVDKYGNSWYAETLPNGTQAWAEMRNGVITEGGLNQVPKVFDPKTGLKANIAP